MPVAKKLATALFLVALGSLGLGGALLLAALFSIGRPSVVGCCCILDSCNQASVVSDAVSRASAWYSADESGVVARIRGFLAVLFSLHSELL